MFKSRLSAWGINKNSNDHLYQLCAIHQHYRRSMGMNNTAFLVNGNNVRTVKDLKKYVKGRKLSDEEFLQLALSKTTIDQALNDDSVRAFTPEADCEGSAEEGEQAAKPSPESDLEESDESPKNEPVSPNRNLVSPLLSGIPVKQEMFNIPGNYPMSTNNGVYDQNFPPSTSVAAQGVLNQQSHVGWNIPSSQYRNQRSPTVQNGSAFAESSGSHPRRTPSCHHFSRQDFDMLAHQTVHPQPLSSIHVADNIPQWRALSDSPPSSVGSDNDWRKVCPTCHQDESAHFYSLDAFETTTNPQNASPRNIFNPVDGSADPSSVQALSVPTPAKDHDAPWQFASACYIACWSCTVYRRNPSNTRAKEVGDHALREATQFFELMLRRNENSTIMTLNQVLLVLGMHDQEGISQQIMQSCAEVAQRVLTPTNPLNIFTRFLVLAAVPANLPGQTEINSLTIAGMYKHYRDLYGERDVRSIGSMYTYGYILNVEAEHEDNNIEKLKLSEQVLRSCHELCCQTLQHGAYHLQAIQALSNLHINLVRQRRAPEAIQCLRRGISDSRECLGKMHPKRLDLKMKLAELLLQQGPEHDAEVEQLFWQILEGRVKMLGREHQFTKDIEWVIKEFLTRKGKWRVGSAHRHRFYDIWEWNDLEMFDYATGAADELAPAGAF